MKTILFFASISLFFLSACTKSTITNLGYTGEVTPLYTKGEFGPFGKGSVWQYENTFCDSTVGNCRTDIVSFLHGDNYDVNEWQFTKLYDRTMHFDEGNYYEFNGDQLIKVLVEDPVAGMTWFTTIRNRTYSYTVLAVRQTLTVPEGTFTDVVQVEHILTGTRPRREISYYQKGVGLLQREIHQVGLSSVVMKLQNHILL